MSIKIYARRTMKDDTLPIFNRFAQVECNNNGTTTTTIFFYLHLLLKIHARTVFTLKYGELIKVVHKVTIYTLNLQLNWILFLLHVFFFVCAKIEWSEHLRI